MRIQFPYEKVAKNDRVLIYGAGELGQSLFWSIFSGRYCKLAGIVDRQFPDTVSPPLFPVNKISDCIFDKLIIASINKDAVTQIYNILREKGVSDDKIIMNYGFDDFDAQTIPLAGDFPKYYELCKSVIDICNQSKSEFAGDFVYQSFPKIGIKGKRDSAERLVKYRLDDYLDETSSVIDIGCNCGFLDLQIAPFVKKIVGFDVDPEMIRMGDFVSKQLGIDNANFYCDNIFSREIKEKFDAVCLFAVHGPILNNGFISANNFVDKIMNLINSRGYLFFESHAYFPDSADQLYDSLTERFQRSGMKLISYRYHYGICSGNMNRDFSVFRMR